MPRSESVDHCANVINAEQVLQRLQHRLPDLFVGTDRRTPVARLRMDSLDVVELLCVLDDEFGVHHSVDEFERIRTLGDLAELIADRCANKEPNP